jgi:hypothetical protein
MNALCRTNSQLYPLLNVYLYRRDLTQSEGKRSLLWAAKRTDGLLIRESTSTAQWALDAGRHLDQIPECYHLALEVAARYGHVRLVELLLKIDGINPNLAYPLYYVDHDEDKFHAMSTIDTNILGTLRL